MLQQFDQKAMAEGALSVKQKELIGVAVAHVTGCPYCIEIHVETWKAGGTKEEMAEAIMAATALKPVQYYRCHQRIQCLWRKWQWCTLYTKGDMKNLAQFNETAPEINKAFQQFDAAAMQEGKLTKKEKEIIAARSRSCHRCPYCIEIHTSGAKKLGVQKKNSQKVYLSAFR